MDNLETLQQNAADAANLLKAMSNESRLMILCALLGNEMSVGELNALIPLSQSALSQHLAALRKSALVTTRKEAQTVYYSVASDSPAKVIEVLKSIYCPDEEGQ
ncbi:MAG: metalloregulator ArsR/SmtB family transcription factor [Gallionella sp.]